jgi:hypothetical protein
MLTLLTGPPACGKNTISHLYAVQHSGRCAVIDGDLVRWMLRQPHKAPWEGEEGRWQHELGAKHSCLLAASFAREGCEVLMLDVVDDGLAAQYRQHLAPQALRIVRLLPTWEETLRRLNGRPHSVTESEARMLYEGQLALRGFDFTLDNSQLSPDEVVRWLADLSGHTR